MNCSQTAEPQDCCCMIINKEIFLWLLIVVSLAAVREFTLTLLLLQATKDETGTGEFIEFWAHGHWRRTEFPHALLFSLDFIFSLDFFF